MSQFFNQGGRGRGRGRGRGGRGGYGRGGGAFGGNGGVYSQQNADTPFPDNAMAAKHGNGPVQVSVKGWRGGTEQSFLQFLDRKVGRPVNVQSVNYRGDVMYISIPNTELAQDLLKLTGIRFAGDKLNFQLKNFPVKFAPGSTNRDDGGGFGSSSPSNNSSSVNTRDQLIALLQTRADAEGSTLDLSALAQDHIIQSLGASPLSDGRIYKAMLVLAAQLYPNLITVNLSNNYLSSLRPIVDLGSHFPRLRNLSLMNNSISSFQELDLLSSAKSTAPLGQLNELILTGNPVCDSELQLPNGAASYVDKVQQRFPTISMLDMNHVTPREQPHTGHKKHQQRPSNNLSGDSKKMPFAINQSFVENQDISELTNAFLAGFFDLYDNNREGLANIYDDAAQFSLMADTTPPTSTFAQTSPQSQKHVDLSDYIKISRNVLRIRAPQKRISTLHVGRSAIMQMISQLPATNHPVQEAQRFGFDAWQTDISGPNGTPQTAASVVIHGEFTETQSQNTMSFDRAFVLLPAPPGSPAASMGSPCVIVNDQLTIRRYNGFQNWQDTDMASGDGGSNAIDLTPEQQQMAGALQEQTGLNVEWTLKYLEGYGWNFQLAMSEFPRVRQTLPAEAFQ